MHGSAAPLLQRRALLRAVKGLNLGLLISAQHLRVVGLVKIHADEIGELLYEVFVFRELEGHYP